MKEQIDKQKLPGPLIHLHEFMCKYYDDNPKMNWGVPTNAVLDYYSNITFDSFIRMESLLWFSVMVCSTQQDNAREIMQRENLIELLKNRKIKEFYVLLDKDNTNINNSYCIFYISAKAASIYFNDLYASVWKQLKDKK